MYPLLAREFEDAVVEVLLTKTKVAIEKYSPKTLIIGGGVIANKILRESFLQLQNKYPELTILIPEKQLTTDNATMIAIASYMNNIAHNKALALTADGNLDIG
jgi:N6-L-threonylcarbamoyladenine synthase